MKTLKQFLNTNLPKQFIYYNNKASIKIQSHKQNESTITNYLNTNNIPFTIEYPEYIIHQFYFYPNHFTIRIKK
jgi:hypothetical protein